MRTNSKAISFADLITRKKQKITRTGAFLEKINSLIDFSFTKDIHKKFHNASVGRSPYSATMMFKIILLQQWYGLSDAAVEEYIYEMKSYQEFLELTLDDDIPDETTICRFRNALIEDELDKEFFAEVNRQLGANGIKVSKGSIVDATINEVPKGRKKEDKESSRDEEASFTKKNSRTYHGYKGHISTDTKGKFIKKCHTSTVKDHDSQHEDKILTGEEDVIFGDSAYINKEKKKEMRKNGKFYGTVERAVRGHPLSSSQKKRNRKISSVRCRVEHPFAEMKCRMNFKPRYKGLRKNEWQFMMASAAYNLKRLIGQIIPAQKQAVIWMT